MLISLPGDENTSSRASCNAAIRRTEAPADYLEWIARQAADLVLMDDSFASIVGGVRLGRRIFVNLRKALIYVTAIHLPIAGLALLPIVLGLPQLLFPKHVVFLELSIDPVCAMVCEAEPGSASAMQRPPRRRDEALFGPAQLGLALLQGTGVLVAVFSLYIWSLSHYPEAEARGAAFRWRASPG